MSVDTLLSEQEAAELRRFVDQQQREHTTWNRWSTGLLCVLPPLGFLVTARWLGFWYPSQLAARGLALCQSHSTLHKGVVWWPSARVDLPYLLRGSSGLLTLCAVFLALMGGIAWVQEQRMHRVATLLARIDQPSFATNASARQDGA